MGDILVATSGYSYDDWRGTLYPDELPKQEFLKYYALFFPFVELNFSYYAMPTTKGLTAMTARTPEGFLFSLKAHQSLTHKPGPGWKDDAAVFLKAASCLADAGRLAAVLVQLPFSFHHTPANRTYLAALLDALWPLPRVVEFRNDEWAGQRVYDELEKRGVGCVMVDRPELPGLPPVGERITGSLGYIRFHGRNSGQWWAGDAVSRYDYLYSADELQAWVPRIKGMAKAATVLVAFNNHAKGKAVQNARELTSLLFPA